MVVIKKLGVLSVAKLQAVLMAIVGFIAGLSFAVFGDILFPGLGLLTIVIMPIIYAIMGFIGGAIGAFLYNIVAGWVGGIEIEFER